MLRPTYYHLIYPPIPIGAIGELYIGGVGLARGYINNPELTKENFVHNPFQTKEEKQENKNSRLYKTGDLVRWLPSGELEYIGRNDFQVKIRGFRIELGEIESVLGKYKSVKQAVVLAKENKETKYLVAYYTSDTGSKLNEDDILSYLATRLPDYMIPTRVVHLDKVPLTLNGKLDRKALPDLELGSSTTTYVAPSNELEIKLRDIFASVLGLKRDKVGINDDFFKLGGNSIMAIKLVNNINNNTPLTFSIADILKYKNIKNLTQNIENESKDIIAIPLANVRQNKQVLSFAQERLFFIHKYEGGTNAYNIPFIYKLNDNTNIKHLTNAIHSTLKRQHILRSTIKEGQNNIYQVINTFSDKYFNKVRVKDSQELYRRITKDINYIFNLSNEFPVKATIYSLEDTEKYISIVIHHIAFDGWSADILLHELYEFYNHYNNNISLTLPKLDIQYKDFAIWQRKYLTGKVLDKQLRYWKKSLDGYENINLPADYPRPLEVDYIGNNINFTLEKQLSHNLRNTAKELGVSLYTLLLASYYLMLKAYSNQDDIVIGTPIANRHYPQIQNLIGFFVNSLPIRIKIKDKQKLAQFIKLLGDQIIDAQLHQDLPFEKLVDELKVEKDTSRHPIFQVVFGVRSFGDNKRQYKDNILLPYDKQETKYNVAKFDIETFIDDSDEVLRGSFNYRVSLYKESTIKRFINTYINILEQISKVSNNKELTLRELTYLNNQKAELILRKWNDTDKEYPSDKTIHSLFEEQVLKSPNNVSVVYEDIKLTYKELNNRANQLANYLIKHHNIKPDDLVALLLGRSEHMIIAILGVLKAGAAYLPMDPEYPDDRIKYILSDTNTNLIISNNTYTKRINSINTKVNIIPVDDKSFIKTLTKYSNTNPKIHNLSSNNIAYVIYTSGTTGNPKGVQIEHKSVVNYITNYTLRKIIEANDRVDVSSSIGFDLTVTTIINTLCCGAAMILYNQKLQDIISYKKYLNFHNITVIKLVPSYFTLLLDDSTKINSKKIILGGEKVEESVIPKLESFYQKNSGEVTVYDEYGPTETTVGACLNVIYNSLSKDYILHSIGKVLYNLKAYVLSECLSPLPVGAIGELYIGGAGLARGYLNNPKLTDERFIPNPFQTEEEKQENKNSRLYKTGDLARWLPSGELEYIGRNDFQVKIRGFRIELGEIESVISEYKGVKQAVVLAKENKETNNKYLVAYYTSETKAKLNEDKIISYLATKLPDYMVPTAIVHLDKLPLTLNGKLDKKALPDPTLTNIDNYLAPRNEIESKLCNIFADVLGLKEDKVGINDDFFKLGGDSIVSIQLVSRIRQRLNINYITIKDIFSYKTIAKLYDNIIKTRVDSKEEISIVSEQGILTGTVLLLPIQKWFFESNFEVAHRWNQAFVIKTPELDVTMLLKCIRVLVDYHDAFRLRFNKDNIEYYDDKAKVEKLKIIDVSKLSSEKELPSILTNLQSNFNLRYGPTYSIAYIHGFKDHSSRVFFALHHLIVDAVSWRILTQNLQHLYDQATGGRNLSLGNKLTSYRQWSNIINNYYSNHDKENKEKTYWDNITKCIVDNNTVLNKLTYSKYNNSSFSMSDKITNSLLKQSNNAYHTEINDLLLSALALALDEALEGNTNYITLEGHGREDSTAKDNIDLSNTLGWFTTMYPVKLNSKDNIATTIKYIKETLRNIPNKGIGYGAIIGYDTLPPISFNYLGQLDQSAKNDYWSIINEDTGITVSTKNKDKNIININGAIISGKLSFSIVSKLSSRLHNKLVNSFKQKLEEVITYTASLKRSYLTISDINNVVTGGYLDKIQDKKDVEALYLAGSLQQGFIYHHLHQGDIDDAYIVQIIWTYNNKLNVNLLEKAWKSAQVKYPTLRLKLLWDNDLLQVIDKKGSLDFRFIDFSNTKNIKEQTKEINKIQQNDRKEPYALNKGSLFRVYLIKQNDDLYTCLFSSHHGVLDGWSMPILLQYIHSTYLALLNNKPIDITLDQAYLEAQAYIQNTRDSNNTYWQTQLSKVEEYLNLNHLISNKGLTNTLSEYRHIKQHKIKTLYIKDKLYDNLKTLSKQQGVTLNAILQFVWHKVLAVFGTNNSGSSTTIVGATISGRDLPINNIESSVGLYINTLPLIMQHNNKDTILDAIRKLQNNITEMNSRSNSNLAKLQKEGNRLFDTLFVYENYPRPVNNNDDCTLNIIFKESVEKLDYPIAAIAYDTNKQLNFSLKYAGELFDSSTMKRLLNTLDTLLTGVSNVLYNSTIAVSDLSYLNKGETDIILRRWNDTDKDYPSDKTVHSLFEEQVLKFPNNVAVVYEDAKLTYKELNERANQLAHYLIKHNIKPDDLVALLLDRSAYMIIAILGVLKAGAAYVPMDPEYPDDRIKYILSDTNTSIVITNSVYTKRINTINNKVNTTAIDDRSFIKNLTKSNTNPVVNKLTSNNFAYVIYTSGTTGEPKGVQIEHKGVVNLNCALSKRYNLEKNEVILQLSNYIFDASVEQISLALLSGNTLACINSHTLSDINKFYYYLNKYKVSQINGSSSLLNQYDIKSIKSIRRIVYGGEKLKTLLKPDKRGGYKIINIYGPTETTIAFTVKFIKNNTDVSIGTPISNTKAYVLSECLSPLPVGAIGELYIGGVGLARGYLNKPQLTKEKFIPNPFKTYKEKQQNKNSRLYKTGDLVRWLPSGELEYIGRNDFQIKIRGFRIELGEIENVLNEYTGVKQTVVLARENKETNNKYLVAYYTSETKDKLSEDNISSYLATKLPDYMIPTAIVYLDKLPLTLNGKLDRKALPDLTLSSNSETYLAPRNELETKLRDIFASVLGFQTDKVGINDDFFKLGGNSITAIKLVNNINQCFKSSVKIIDIFLYKNIVSIINRIFQTKQKYTTLIKFGNAANKTNLFMVHPGVTGCEAYISLANGLEEYFSCYGVDSYNLYAEKKIDNLKQLAQYYLSHIEQVMRKGNQDYFHLLGWSLGGTISLEIASILETKGYKNITLYLLDTHIKNKNIKNIAENELEDLKVREKMIKQGYDKTYVDKVIANRPTESKLSLQPISTKLKYTNILLFKAMLKKTRFTVYEDVEEDKRLTLKDNNLNKVIAHSSQLKVIRMLNSYHGNILNSEELLVKEIIEFKNNKSPNCV